MIKRSINSFWIDILVAFSCISVVYLHVNNDVFWQRSHGWLWISSNIIECLFYAAVPCFFMISGYTLMDYRERYNTKVFLKRRLFRAFLPFIFWSFVFFHIYHKNNFIPRFYISIQS